MLPKYTDMALSDIKRLAEYAREHEKNIDEMSMIYDSGRSSMVHARGNILLGKERYVRSLKVGKIRKFFMDILF